jgi:hypothetical protein
MPSLNVRRRRKRKIQEKQRKINDKPRHLLYFPGPNKLEKIQKLNKFGEASFLQSDKRKIG